MPEIELTYTEGFSLVGVGSNPYTFDNWLTPTEGTSDDFDWEAGTLEGFTITGNSQVVTTFADWLTPTGGSDATYDFESDDEGFTESGAFCTAPYTFDDPMRTTADCT